MIVDFSELKEIKKQKETVVMQFLIGYYKDMQDSSGKIDIPYFIKAKQTYDELIHNSKDLKVVYDKVLKTRKLCQSLNVNQK